MSKQMTVPTAEELSELAAALDAMAPQDRPRASQEAPGSTTEAKIERNPSHSKLRALTAHSRAKRPFAPCTGLGTCAHGGPALTFGWANATSASGNWSSKGRFGLYCPAETRRLRSWQRPG
jgi:hypothetical protein